MANQGKSLNTVGGIEQANAIQRELHDGKQKAKVGAALLFLSGAKMVDVERDI